MKKRIWILAAIAAFSLAFTACGTPEGETYGEDYGVETEMNGRFETIVDDDKKATPEPTEAPSSEERGDGPTKPEETPSSEERGDGPTTPEATATPEPTTAPEVTEEPTPTEAPVAETKGFAVVLKELHSLETYAEREAYIAQLDKSLYEAAVVDCSEKVIEEDEDYTVTELGTFDLIEDFNSKEVEEYDGPYKIIIRTPDTNEEVYSFVSGNASDDDWEKYYDYMDNGYIEENVYPTRSVGTRLTWFARNEYRGGELMNQTYVDEYGDETSLYGGSCNGEIYFMTLTDLTTGETDPWGVKVHFDAFNYETYEDTLIVESVTIEDFINDYNHFVCEADAWDGFYDPMAKVTTWETLKHYNDIFTPQTEFEIEMPW